jgi:hypothetical protein
MDDYLEKYVENAIEKQVYRNGIEFSPSWIKRIFSRRSKA